MGGNNSGKTFIASISVQEAIKNNLSAKFYDWSNLVDILSNFSRKEELNEAIFRNSNRPKLTIANTIKGHGVSFMENSVPWHYKSPNAEELASALNEIGYSS